MSGRSTLYLPKPLLGVFKPFDLGGKVVDATPYFGGGSIQFGRDYTPYLVASAALVTPAHFIPFDLGWGWRSVPEGATVEIDRLTLS